nr:alpha/beta fold hydrolase [Deinobacterium chartae]
MALVYHGVTAAKEGNAGVFTPLLDHGIATVMPDSAGHGERRERGLSSEALGYRNFLRTCAAFTALEAPRVIDALQQDFPGVALGVIGISMGGYTAHYLALREKRVRAAVVISSGGLWQEPEVTLPFARAFIEEHRPVDHAAAAPPTALALLHGEADPVFPMTDLEATAEAYRGAYHQAGLPQHLLVRSYPDVAHYTATGMRDDAVAFLAHHL